MDSNHPVVPLIPSSLFKLGNVDEFCEIAPYLSPDSPRKLDSKLSIEIDDANDNEKDNVSDETMGQCSMEIKVDTRVEPIMAPASTTSSTDVLLQHQDSYALKSHIESNYYEDSHEPIPCNEHHLNFTHADMNTRSVTVEPSDDLIDSHVVISHVPTMNSNKPDSEDLSAAVEYHIETEPLLQLPTDKNIDAISSTQAAKVTAKAESKDRVHCLSKNTSSVISPKSDIRNSPLVQKVVPPSWTQTVSTAVAEYTKRKQTEAGSIGSGDTPSYEEVMKVLAHRKKLAEMALTTKTTKLSNLESIEGNLTELPHSNGLPKRSNVAPSSSYYRALSVLSNLKKTLPVQNRPKVESKSMNNPLQKTSSSTQLAEQSPTSKDTSQHEFVSIPLHTEKRGKHSPDTVKRHKFALTPPAAIFKMSTSSSLFLEGRTHYSSTFWRLLDSPASWITVYFVLNLSITIYNKAIFSVFDFTFPWLLTAVHSFISAICASMSVFWLDRQFRAEHNWDASPYAPPLSWADNVKLLGFSALYTLNIAVSNMSLSMVSLPFHQIVRSINPVVTVAMERVFCSRRPNLETCVALLTVIIGVSLATLGEYQFSQLGIIMTCLGVLLSATKGILTNRLLTGSLKLHPLDLLRRMAFASLFQCLAIAYWCGEWDSLAYYLKDKYDQDDSQVEYNGGRWKRNADTGDWEYAMLTPHEMQEEQNLTRNILLCALVLNGLLAFLLNFVSFTANKRTSALSMSVAGNVKQAMSVTLSVLLFSFLVTSTNGIGILLTFVGGAWYSLIGLRRPSSVSKLFNE